MAAQAGQAEKGEREGELLTLKGHNGLMDAVHVQEDIFVGRMEEIQVLLLGHSWILEPKEEKR